MDYKQTIDFLFSQLPVYQRIGAAAYKIDLSNTVALCDSLGNPQNNFRSIHIAGTNGKGSVSHLLASVMQNVGLKTGLYTSPHFKDFRERIKINGEMISEQEVVTFVEKNKESWGAISPSFFEMTVAMAFDHFSTHRVDIAIIETGLGGRLDSTNVIAPLLSVITNIGLDHTEFLGDNLTSIAQEKAGIIKPGVPAVVGETTVETKKVFESVAKNSGSEITFAEDLKWDFNEEESKVDQLNKRTAYMACKTLNKGLFEFSDEEITKGFEDMPVNTGYMGRWQTLSNNPMTICDMGHNEDGINHVLKQIALTPHSKLHCVLGFVNDKNYSKLLELFPKNAVYYFCQASIPRALDVKVLKEEARSHGLNGSLYQSVNEAVKSAQHAAKSDDLVFIGGSTFVVAEALQ